MTVDGSRNKVYAAAALTLETLETPTREPVDSATSGESLYGVRNADRGRIVVFGGDYPLERDGEILGAIGVTAPSNGIRTSHEPAVREPSLTNLFATAAQISDFPARKSADL